MEAQKIQEYFKSIIESEKDLSAGVAAIRTLMEVIRKSQSGTVQELEAHLKDAIHNIKNCNVPVAAINSGCELFLRFITLVGMDTVGSFSDCKKLMLGRGDIFLKNLYEARDKISKHAIKFISDGSKILTHSRSGVVLQTLFQAHQMKKRFEVFVAVSGPDNSGQQMYKELQAMGIPCTLILDSSIGYIMEQISFVMVGAEGVAESGGIVNKIGTYTMAVCAKIMNKSFYVLTESFKFARVFPLNQKDLPDEYKYTSAVRESDDLKKAHPCVDYTPPSYITLLFTDLGILTTAAVCDQLINLYL